MSDADQNKSEAATPFKLLRARERGVVARGVDLGFLAVLAAFMGFLWFAGPGLIESLARSAREAIVSAPYVTASPHELIWTSGSVLASVIRPLAYLVTAVFVVVLLAELAQTGFVFSSQPLSPDFSRLSPANGFKRVFSVRMLVETAKNVLKLAVYGALAWLVLRRAQTLDIGAITTAADLGRALFAAGFRLVAYFVAGAVVFAIADQLIARREFSNKMRMTRRDIRREARDREGDPRLKQRRRVLHREFVKLSQSVKNIRGADVLITNPFHIAVALKYDPATMAAPRVVSRGAHQFAQRLKRLAFVYGLVVVENRPLAQALYRQCQIDQPVPESLYRDTARIYSDMRNAKMKQQGDAQRV